MRNENELKPTLFNLMIAIISGAIGTVLILMVRNLPAPVIFAGITVIIFMLLCIL